MELCTVGALNGEYVVTGTVKGTPDGALVRLTHAGSTEQGTLLLGGQKAGIEGTLTQSARLNSIQVFNLLSTTKNHSIALGH